MCAPYFSAGDRCLDPAVLADYHLDQDLLYPSYSQGSLDVTEGIDDPEKDEGNFVGRVLGVARGGDLGRHNGTRVLWLEGHAASVLRVSSDSSSLLAAMTHDEKRFLDEFYEWCAASAALLRACSSLLLVLMRRRRHVSCGFDFRAQVPGLQQADGTDEGAARAQRSEMTAEWRRRAVRRSPRHTLQKVPPVSTRCFFAAFDDCVRRRRRRPSSVRRRALSPMADRKRNTAPS